MIKFENGCEDKKTLATYSMFHKSPHVSMISMDSDDEGNETVSVEFIHYSEIYMCNFHTSHDAGEVWKMEMDGQYNPYGMITPESLFTLLRGLPHIDRFLVECAEGVH